MAKNQVILKGRLTRKPELNFTAAALAVTNITLAVQGDQKDESGEYPVDFIPITVWGGGAQDLCNRCGQGDYIEVEPRVKMGPVYNGEVDNAGNVKKEVQLHANRYERLRPRATT